MFVTLIFFLQVCLVRNEYKISYNMGTSINGVIHNLKIFKRLSIVSPTPRGMASFMNGPLGVINE